MSGWVRRLAVTMVLAAAITTAPAAAAAPAVPETAAAARLASTATDAAAASTEARSLRLDVAALLQRYIDEYGDRFTGSELAQLRGYKANADRRLAAVVLTTNRLKYLTARGAPAAQVKAAAGRAMTAWTRAKAAADTSWEDARRIMEPKLSLLEKLGAANDYTTMMDRFDALGERIRALR